MHWADWTGTSIIYFGRTYYPEHTKFSGQAILHRALTGSWLVAAPTVCQCVEAAGTAVKLFAFCLPCFEY